jgi:hypothetical protein
MEKLITFFIAIAFNLVGLCQNIDRFIGKYDVSESFIMTAGETHGYSGTSSYIINVEKFNDTIIAIPHFHALGTLMATVISDSIDIFNQTFYFNEHYYFIVHGSGSLYGNTLKYKYTAGGPFGVSDNNCVGIKMRGTPLPLFSKDKIWTEARTTSDSYVPIGTQSYKVWKDTLINGKNHSIVITDSGTGKWDTTHYYNLIYEDSGKVYQNNLLYYDFNMKPGDSLVYDTNDKIVVDSINHREMIDGDFRKHFYLSYFEDGQYISSFTWIEGIGSVWGLNNPIVPSEEFGGESFLLCVHENGELVYQNPEFNTCSFPSNTKRLTRQENLLNLFVADDGIVNIRSITNIPGEICFYSIDGKQLLKEKVETESQSISVPTTGILIYHFINIRQQIQTGKVIVQ